jgi:hypothetical protein
MDIILEGLEEDNLPLKLSCGNVARMTIFICRAIFLFLRFLFRPSRFTERIARAITSNPELKASLKRLGHKHKWGWGRIIRIVFLGIAMFWIFFLLLLPLLPFLREMLRNYGYWYFIFAAMVGINLFLASSLINDFANNDLKKELLAMNLPLAFGFLYLATLAFAGHIYPYIPAERGGGDYTAEKAWVLTFDALLSNSIPTNVLSSSKTNLQSKKAVILDETANTIYIAIPTDGTNEIAKWRENIPITADHSNSRPQRIFAIKREAVVEEQSEPW